MSPQLMPSRRAAPRWRVILATVVATGIAIALLMNFAVPEKQLEVHVAHRFAVADPQFRREMRVMLGPTILGGNRVTPLQNGDTFFPEMLAAVAAARSTISFETYIYSSGAIGQQMTDALAERARAGVAVAVIVDWVGSLKMDEALLAQLTEAGARVERYRPLRWYHLGRLNNRTHRKLLVVDGRVAFTGGAGIADQWLGDAEDPDHWRDMQFRVEGPVVAQFQAAFNDNWIRTTGELVHGPAHFPPLAPVGTQDAHLFISSPASGSDSMHLMFLMSMAAAAATIDLSASYFVPDALIERALIEARQRGVRIRILVPGEHIDSEVVRLASRGGWGPLLQAGVEFYEYQPTMMHAKALVVDGELVSVGSTNVDLRSFQLNDEASLNVYDRALAAELTAVFEADLQRARRVTLESWARRPWREKFMERVVWPIRSQL
ncbi:MAG: phosphatidylserine/phosphatidylglycerophosphate/cardiolipin synthase family protein [Vicinamibacterales bacterium]